MTATTRQNRPGLPSRRRIPAVLLAILVGVGLVFALYHGYWKFFEYRMTTISEGEVYQSAQMSPKALEKAVREYGIRSVLDLRAADEDPEQTAREREVLAGLGVNYLHLPAHQVPEFDTVDRFLELVALEENRPMLIHCEHGVGRSVLFAALYRVEFEGWDNEEARRATRLIPNFSSFSRTEPKGRFLTDYEPRRRGGS